MPMPFGATEAPPSLAPFNANPPLLDTDAQMKLAVSIADRAVISDIESEAIRLDLDGRAWWDTRLMTDAREHAPEVVELASDSIRYAVGTGLASVHPNQPYLLTFER